VLLVPSIVARKERNVLINPVHPDANGFSVTDPEQVVWDERLFRGGCAKQEAHLVRVTVRPVGSTHAARPLGYEGPRPMQHVPLNQNRESSCSILSLRVYS